MLTFHNLPVRLDIRAVDICRLLPIILREYREFGPCGCRGFHRLSNFEDI